MRSFDTKTLYLLGKLVLQAAVREIKACKLRSVIFDRGAFFLESQKSDVEMNYERLEGYNPVAVTCAELKMPMAGLFRPGSASCLAHLSELLKRVIAALPGINIRVRSDSAGYQAGVVVVLDEAKVDYTITARKDAAVMTAISEIPKGAWKDFESSAWPNRETEIADTHHVFSTETVSVAHRLIVLRWLKKQQDLFDTDPYEYHAVYTSFDSWTAGLVLQYPSQSSGRFRKRQQGAS